MANRPTPSELRKLSGSNLHRINKREARFTKITTAEKEMPKWLDEVGQEEYMRLAPEVINNRLLNRGNLMYFAIGCCESYARCMFMINDIRTTGYWMDEDVYNKKGDMVGSRRKPNPMLSKLSEALKDMKGAYQEFGLTPAAATKVEGEPPSVGAGDGSFGDFLGGEDDPETEGANASQLTN